jgi:hypothetical protein
MSGENEGVSEAEKLHQSKIKKRKQAKTNQ